MRLYGVGLIGIVLLASCAPRLTLLVSPEALDVAQQLQKDAVKQGLSGLVILDDRSPFPSNGAVLRLTSTPGWNLPSAALKSLPFPQGLPLPDEFSPSVAFDRQFHDPKGSWAVLPLFFDTVGVSTYYRIGSPQVPPLPQWTDLNDRRWRHSLVIAGRSPLARQANFFFSADRAPTVVTADWFLQPAHPWDAETAAVPRWMAAGVWLPSTWQFAAGDVKVLKQPQAKFVYFRTYRQFEQERSSTPERFIAWSRSWQKNQSAMEGEVLFLEQLRTGGDRKQLASLVHLLCSPRFQGQIGASLKWMGVNRLAPVIDSDADTIRRQVDKSSIFLPLTDRLPSPLTETNLMSSVEVHFNLAPIH